MQVEDKVVITGFALVGALLKYIDASFDENEFTSINTVLAAAVALAIWLFLSSYDTISANILAAILLSALFSGKVDNKVFKISSIAALFFFAAYAEPLFSVLVFLSLLGTVDEKANDYADKNAMKNRALSALFKHRAAMKAGVAILYLKGEVNFVHLIAFMLFDVSYDAVSFSIRKLTQKTANPALEERL
jgi:hypothetical protein